MITGANDTAYPVLDLHQTPNGTTQIGLTKREYLAGQAMHAYVHRGFARESAAGLAVRAADALLKELAK